MGRSPSIGAVLLFNEGTSEKENDMRWSSDKARSCLLRAGLGDGTDEGCYTGGHEEGMEAWMTWAESCGDGLVDIGSPLGNGLTVTDSGSSQSEKGVAGYSILQADSMEGALALLQGHPHLGWAEGCEIEVHECLPLPT